MSQLIGNDTAADMAGETMPPCTIVNTVQEIDLDRLQQFIARHPKGSIFHSAVMVEVYAATKHYQPLFLAALDTSGDILALLVASRIQTLPNPFGKVSARSIWYAEPLCRDDAEGSAALCSLITHHDAQMRRQVLFTEIRPLWAAGVEGAALERCGYEYLGYLNYVINLRRPLDELWAAMSKSCRRSIERSRKRGLEVKDMTSEAGVDLLYDFLQRSYGRSNVPLADKSLFTAALNLLPREQVKISVAYHDGAPLAAGILLGSKDLIYAWYGGLQRVKGLSPFDCLTWHEMEWAHQNGYGLYDFGGAGWPDEPYGVRDFKAKFGGDLVNYGRYRKVYAPRTLRLAEALYGLVRSKMGPQAGMKP